MNLRRSLFVFIADAFYDQRKDRSKKRQICKLNNFSTNGISYVELTAIEDAILTKKVKIQSYTGRVL
jgi:hypothetical protein